MTIRRATAADIRAVALDMRPGDFEEWSATSDVSTRSLLAHNLVARYGGRSDVLVGCADNVPVCIGGAIEVWPGVASLMFFANDQFPRIGRGMTRWIRRELLPRYLRAGVHRIQAISIDNHTEAHAWLRVLGLQPEALFSAFGRNGEDFIQFAMVVDVRPVGAGE